MLRRCGWLAVATLIRGALRYVSRTQLFDLAREIEFEIRNDLFAHLQRLPQSFFQHWRTGGLISRLFEQRLRLVRLMLGPGALSLLQTPVLFLFVIGAMFSLNPTLAVLVLLPYPLFLFVARGFGRSMHRSKLDVQETLATLSNQLQESIAGVAVVKTAMEPVMAERFDARANGLPRNCSWCA